MLEKLRKFLGQDRDKVIKDYMQEYTRKSSIAFSVITTIIMFFIGIVLTISSGFQASSGSFMIVISGLVSLILSYKGKPKLGNIILIAVVLLTVIAVPYFLIGSPRLPYLLIGNVLVLLSLIIPLGIVVNKTLALIIALLSLIHISIVMVLNGEGIDFFVKNFPIILQGLLVTGVFVFYTTYLRDKMVNIIQDYNANLEDMVEKRTEELNETNKALFKRNEQMRKELEMAERVQKNIIPTEMDFPKREELTFGSNYSSMESIGGDLYDVIRVGSNAYGFLIVDVSGHGVPAALITTMAKVSFNTHTGWDIPTANTCKRVNEEIFRFIGDLEYYLTAYYCVLNLENGKLMFTNAGHHPAIVYRKETGKLEYLDTMGYFIGAFEEGTYETGEIEIHNGDRILLFTDGIIEARNNKREFYGYERLKDFIINNSHLGTKEFVDMLIEDVGGFCGDQPQDDDRAILYIEMVTTMSPEKSPQEVLSIEARKFHTEHKEEVKEEFILKEEYSKAIDFIKSKEFREAIEILGKLSEQFPDNPKVLHSLGIAYYKVGELEKAYDILKKALDKDQSNEVLKKNLSIVLKKLN